MTNCRNSSEAENNYVDGRDAAISSGLTQSAASWNSRMAFNLLFGACSVCRMSSAATRTTSLFHDDQRPDTSSSMDKLLFLLSYGNDARQGGGDSFCDRLNCRYTVIMLTVFALVIMSRVHAGDPILCWAPSEFTPSHVAYTNKVRRLGCTARWFEDIAPPAR